MVESWPHLSALVQSLVREKSVEMETETMDCHSNGHITFEKTGVLSCFDCFVNMSIHVVLWFLRLSMQGPSSTQSKHGMRH